MLEQFKRFKVVADAARHPDDLHHVAGAGIDLLEKIEQPVRATLKVVGADDDRIKAILKPHARNGCMFKVNSHRVVRRIDRAEDFQPLLVSQCAMSAFPFCAACENEGEMEAVDDQSYVSSRVEGVDAKLDDVGTRFGRGGDIPFR